MTTLFNLRIGYFDYEVIEDSEKIQECGSALMADHEELELLGMCVTKELKIYIAEGLHVQRQREVIWHEVGHAIHDLSGLQASSMMTGEDAVGSLTLLQLMVLRDNPHLLEFLIPKGE